MGCLHVICRGEITHASSTVHHSAQVEMTCSGLHRHELALQRCPRRGTCYWGIVPAPPFALCFLWRCISILLGSRSFFGWWSRSSSGVCQILDRLWSGSPGSLLRLGCRTARGWSA